MQSRNRSAHGALAIAALGRVRLGSALAKGRTALTTAEAAAGFTAEATRLTGCTTEAAIAVAAIAGSTLTTVAAARSATVAAEATAFAATAKAAFTRSLAVAAFALALAKAAFALTLAEAAFTLAATEAAEAGLAAIAFRITAGAEATVATAITKAALAVTTAEAAVATETTTTTAGGASAITTTAFKAAATTAATAFVAAGCALCRLETRNHLGLELLTAVAFDIENAAAVTEFRERHGHAFATGTTGAADAVGVVGCRAGKVVIHHGG